MTEHRYNVQELVERMSSPTTTVAGFIGKAIKINSSNMPLLEQLRILCATQVQVFPVAILDKNYEYVRNTWQKVIIL